MDRTEVITGVAGELYATEHAVDAALTQVTALVQSIIAGRGELDLSPVAFAPSQAKAMETLVALGAARDAIIACHAEMQKDHRRMGWGVYASGPINKPNEWDSRPVGRGHLRVA